MKKKIAIITCLLALNACALSGCGEGASGGQTTGTQTTQQLTTETDSSTTSTTQAATESQTVDNTEAAATTQSGNTGEITPVEGDTSSYYMQNVYKSILDKYRTAISENWDYAKCLDADICPLFKTSDTASFEDIGAALIDMDNDGYLELIIGNPKDTTGKSVYDVWTYNGSTAAKLITAHERSLLNIGYQAEDNVYYISAMGSNSATEFQYDYYTVFGGSINNIQSVACVTTDDGTETWYQVYSGNDSRKEITADEANNIIDSYTNAWILPEYLSIESK